MKTNIRHIITAAGAALAMCSMSSCIEEVTPTNLATPDVINSSSTSLTYLCNSLPSFLTTWDTYGTSGNTQDWGYPCQIYMREVFGEDFPASDNGYNYWSYYEDGSSLRYAYYYPYYYYYSFIKNANNVIGTARGNESSEAKPYLGQGLGYRAMLYLDMARLYEYRKTGVESLDKEAEELGSYGITVPIVTENTSATDLTNNPCAPFTTMYRFIMHDLDEAETCLSSYVRTNKAFMDRSVIYGLKARLWLTIASRVDQSADDLQKMKDADANADGYGTLGITDANYCYAKAAEYAQKAMSGYSPLTQDEWTNVKTGFNTANDSWILGTLVNSKEQINTSYWNTFLGWMASEAEWGMCTTKYNGFRCIGKRLYDKIGTGDWRRNSWVNPDDVITSDEVKANTSKTIPSKYKTQITDISTWSKLPAYANLKFRPGSGELTTLETGLIASMPLMRYEEMMFDYIEAIAHTQGVATAAQKLQTWVNTYRYTDKSYKCSSSDMDSFITDLMVQRRIELWGEGLVFFDYKRLNLPVKRSYTGSNYASNLQLNSYNGYVAPWMNYMIPETEKDMNPAVTIGPNCSGAISAE